MSISLVHKLLLFLKHPTLQTEGTEKVQGRYKTNRTSFSVIDIVQCLRKKMFFPILDYSSNILTMKNSIVVFAKIDFMDKFMNVEDISDIVKNTNSCRCHHILKALVILNYLRSDSGTRSIRLDANWS